MQRIYQQALSDEPHSMISAPKEKYEGCYRGRLVVDGQWINLHSVEVYVDGILVQGSYAEDPAKELKGKVEKEREKTDTGDESEIDSEDDGYSICPIELDPKIQYPFDLPESRNDCLKHWTFCIIGTQEPYTESMIEAVIKHYKGALVDFNKAIEDSVSRFPTIHTILGKMEKEDPKLIRVQGKDWKGPVIDQRKLFGIIENMGDTTSWSDYGYYEYGDGDEDEGSDVKGSEDEDDDDQER